jgi:hypothetical protein
VTSVSSLEADEDGSSGGSHRWRIKGGGDMMTPLTESSHFGRGCQKVGMCLVYIHRGYRGWINKNSLSKISPKRESSQSYFG